MYRKLDSSDKPRCLDRFLKKIADLHNLTDTPCADTRFVDQGDGTVIDNFTGLIWEKKTNADGVASFFFHPYYDLSILKQIVAGVKTAGYTFVAPSSL